MKAYLVKNAFGIFLLDENKHVIDYRLFPEKELIDRNMMLHEGKVTPEELELIEKYKDQFDKIVIEKPFYFEKYADKIEITDSLREFREAVLGFLLRQGIIRSEDEYRKKLIEIAEELTRRKMQRRHSEPDMVIIHCINTVEDLDKITNMLMERLREFYNLYFPELDNLVDDHKTYALLVKELTSRENYTKENLERLKKEGAVLKDRQIEDIVRAARVSMGGNVPEEILQIYKDYASTVLELYDLRKRLTDIIDSYTKEYTPNLRALIGPTVLAKLLALAGSLERLAKLPASTIQVIGAEKALFRHLRTGAKPPKHGVIFQVPEIRYAPKKLRGKIARALATKLAIAAKADAFTKRFIGNKLREAFLKRLEEIKKGKR
ncbi:MAG: C/D box methylation guide ribonucleoprotein complex aNOP56 subunit [bacterium]|nr:C/D box methylation guide ribonucleoprotein complex aNOP56 subunit [bacterium]